MSRIDMTGFRVRHVSVVGYWGRSVDGRLSGSCSAIAALRGGRARACRSSRTGWRRPHRFLKR
jgi:hypothetical protein